MVIEILPEADADIDAALAWYAEKNLALAIRLAREIKHASARAAERPFAWTQIEPGIRRVLLTGFPYGVIYRVMGERIVVMAVTHQHREPGHWRGRG